jgi:hypothetical protein
MVLDAQLFDAPEVDRAGAAVSAVHGVTLIEQQLRQVSAVLACYPGDDCFLLCFFHIRIFIFQ